MTVYVFDLNDSDLRIAREQAIVARSSGYAMIDEDRLLLGDDALRQFRLHPRQANNLFWHRLNTESLGARTGNVANYADLVYRHLKTLADTANISADDELIVAASATTTPDQLGLLLGIAEQIGIRVTGLVDSAVATAAAVPVPTQFRYIDVSLHRMAVTQVESATELRRVGWQDVAELSLSTLLDAWVNVIADRFVRETRFDPLANAVTEQQVYNQVFDWLADGARATEIAVEVHNGAVHRRVDLSATILTEKATARYRLAEKVIEGAPVLLSHRAAALPGFVSALRTYTDSVTVCEANALFSGVVRHADVIRSSGDGVRFVTRLPSMGVPRDATRPAALPTHVVFEHRAVAIGAGITLTRNTFPNLPAEFPDGAVAISRAGTGIRLSIAAGTALALDGTPGRDGAELKCGSAIEVAGARFGLIEVVNGA